MSVMMTKDEFEEFGPYISESDYVNYLVDKIASFFEREENWSTLKGCWLENGKSNCFRKLLHEALKEVNLNVFES